MALLSWSVHSAIAGAVWPAVPQREAGAALALLYQLFAQRIRRDSDKYREIVERLGLKID